MTAAVGSALTSTAIAPLATAAASAFGTITTARAQEQVGAEQQAAFNMQAASLETQAGQVEVRGKREEEVSRAQIKRLMSAQRALYAKAGVDLSSGSPLTVLAATAAEGEREAQAIRTNVAAEAAGVRTTAELRRFSGASAKRTAKTRAKSTLLSGLGSAASSLLALVPQKKVTAAG